jgi:hypothetical protein
MRRAEWLVAWFPHLGVRYPISMDADDRAERARALILLRATLVTVADRLDEDSLEDLGLLARMTELGDLVDQDLQRLADSRNTPAHDSA